MQFQVLPVADIVDISVTENFTTGLVASLLGGEELSGIENL
jgi:hypothetical protein